MSDSNTTAHIRIHGYRIVREIGRGGIATVYLAVQESLDREVALKVMSPVLVAEPNFTERFIREGRTVAQLNHPGIVTIFDIAAEDYDTYMAMEYLPGGSLREKLRKPIPEDTVLSIARQMADALACAHDNGIVHRDVKPENIMFRDNGVPVLTDFGIAKTIGTDTGLTRTGIIVGTPRYISPEQAEGRGTDARSDLYSLGVILFEMLAGRPPFGTRDSIALLYSHVNDPIPDLPDEHCHLQPLVNATMAKNPDDRVSDCHKLSDMIYVIHREVRRGGKGTVSVVRREDTNQPPSTADTTEEPAEPTPRNKWWPVAIGAVGVLLIAWLFTEELRTFFRTPSQPELATGPEPIPKSLDLAGTGPVVQPETEVGVAPASEMVADADTTPGATMVTDVADVPVRRYGSEASVESSPRSEASVAVPNPAARSTETDTPEADRSQEPPATASSARVATVDDEQTNKTGWKVSEPGGRPGAPSRLQVLLALAEAQMDRGHVDAPAGDNAVETYRQILKLAADHQQALTGLDEIAKHFLDRSREAAEAKRFQEAQDMIDRGLEAVPKHADLLSFQNNVSLRWTAEKEFDKAEKYYWGHGVQRDPVLAVEWYRKAADKGHVQAQYNLGVAYADGAGVPRDEDEGLRWLRRAAIQGVEEAQFNLSLGLIFGPNPDPDGASQWIKSLAEKNYEPAFQVLGWMYSTGTGVNLSIKESIRWNVKYVMADVPADSSPPQRGVESWNRQLQFALAQTKLDQKPPEPN